MVLIEQKPMLSKNFNQFGRPLLLLIEALSIVILTWPNAFVESPTSAANKPIPDLVKKPVPEEKKEKFRT